MMRVGSSDAGNSFDGSGSEYYYLDADGCDTLTDTGGDADEMALVAVTDTYNRRTTSGTLPKKRKPFDGETTRKRGTQPLFAKMLCPPFLIPSDTDTDETTNSAGGSDQSSSTLTDAYGPGGVVTGGANRRRKRLRLNDRDRQRQQQRFEHRLQTDSKSKVEPSNDSDSDNQTISTRAPRQGRHDLPTTWTC